MRNRLLTFAELAFAVAGRVLRERPQKFAPKLYIQFQLFACLPLKECVPCLSRVVSSTISTASGPSSIC